FVEVRGVVTALDGLNNRALLHVHSEQEHLNVILRDISPGDTDLTRLIDAEVRVRGVCGTITDSRRKVLHVHLLVRKLEDVTVERPAPTPSFAGPAIPISQVAPSNGNHRIKVSGTLTEIVPVGKIIVKDATGEIMARADEQVTAWPGDQI